MKLAVLSLLSVLVSTEIVGVQNNDLNIENIADYDSPHHSDNFSQTEPIFSDFNIRIGDDGFWKLNEETMNPKEIFNVWRKKYFRNYFPE